VDSTDKPDRAVREVSAGQTERVSWSERAEVGDRAIKLVSAVVPERTSIVESTQSAECHAGGDASPRRDRPRARQSV
jgi:hypothetical protein